MACGLGQYPGVQTCGWKAISQPEKSLPPTSTSSVDAFLMLLYSSVVLQGILLPSHPKLQNCMTPFLRSL